MPAAISALGLANLRATIELSEDLRSQRRAGGQDASAAAVLLDLKVLMRASPHRLRAVAELVPAIAVAEQS